MWEIAETEVDKATAGGLYEPLLVLWPGEAYQRSVSLGEIEILPEVAAPA